MMDQLFLAAFSASDVTLTVRTVKVSEIKSFQKLLGSLLSFLIKMDTSMSAPTGGYPEGGGGGEEEEEEEESCQFSLIASIVK